MKRKQWASALMAAAMAVSLLAMPARALEPDRSAAENAEKAESKTVVRLEDREIPSAQDIYLQAGYHIDKPTSEYVVKGQESKGSNYDPKVLKVKWNNDYGMDHSPWTPDKNPSEGSDSQRYARKTLISFPLEDLDGYARFELKLHVKTPPEKDFTTATVRVVDPAEWNDATLTWKSAPAAGEVAAEITKADLAGNVCVVDVTEAVQKAVAAGKTRIAFEIKNKQHAKSNFTEFWSSRCGDETKVPTLTAVAPSKTVASEQDMYLQAGVHIDKPTSQYLVNGKSNYDPKVLKVKWTSDYLTENGKPVKNPDMHAPTQRYTRKSLISFPLKELEGQGFDRFQIELHVKTMPEKHFSSAWVRVLDTDRWDEDIVTWNTAPKGGEMAGLLLQSNIKGDVLTVDVTEAVQKAMAEGKERIAFEIANNAHAKNNFVEFWSSRCGDAAKVPVLRGQHAVPKPDRTEDPVFTNLRKNYRSYLLGGSGTDLDLANPGVKAYLEKLNEKANEYYKVMVKSTDPNRTELFPDMEMAPECSYLENFKAPAAYTKNMGFAARRIRDMAFAWATKGCDLYQDETVKNELISALDFFMDMYYTGRHDVKSGGNWYQWVITAPDALMNACIVLYDEIPAEKLQHYVDVCKHYVPDCMASGPYSNDPRMTGGNLLLKANSTLQTGILDQNREMLKNVKEGVKTTLVYNGLEKFDTKDADGFFRDGSYIQHGALAYIGGYGADLYRNLGVFLKVLNGTEFAIAYPDHCENVAYDTVFNGIEPFMYKDRMMDMVSSRDVTRPGSSDLKRIASIMNSILPLRGAFPTKEQNDRFDSMVKYYLMQNPDFYYQNMGNITAIMTASQILNDASVAPRSSYELTKVFTMDKAVHLNDEFGFGIAMNSTRTYGHEMINYDGKRTWNTSDGMTYLYNEDTRQYADGFWGAIDPSRLPGTTAEHSDFPFHVPEDKKSYPTSTGDRVKNIYPWVGGATLQNQQIGAVGAQMRSVGKADFEAQDPGQGKRHRAGADMKKSWFLFGDKIVALGAGITSTTGNEVETIVENRKIALDGSNRLAVNGKDAGIELTESKDVISTSKGTPVTAEYITLAGECGSKIGYYFPGTAQVNLLKEKRISDWNRQGAASGEVTATFATILFDHGKNPTNAGYAYILMPGADDAAMADYAAAPSIKILQNDENVAAAHDSKSGFTAVNFWNAGSMDKIISDAPASVLFKEEAGVVELAVADPTMQRKEINITLPYEAGEVLAADSTVTITKNAPFTVVSVNTDGMEGGTSAIRFKASAASSADVISVLGEEPSVKAFVNTAFKRVDLPKTLMARTVDGKDVEVGVEWQRGEYNKMVPGCYPVVGELVLPQGVTNSSNVKAHASVTVLEPQVLAAQDTFVRGGKHGDSLMTEDKTPNNDRNMLTVKGDPKDYERRAYIKMDLSGVDPNAPAYYLNFQIQKLPEVKDPKDKYEKTEIYTVANNWQGAALTFNNRPSRLTDQPAAVVTKAMWEESLTQKLDITTVVREALARGEKELSFEFVNVGGGPNATVNIYSRESTAAGVQKPMLSWDVLVDERILDTRNAQMLLNTAAELDGALYSNFDEAALTKAVAELEKLVRDPDTVQEELELGEDALCTVLNGLRFVPKAK